MTHRLLLFLGLTLLLPLFAYAQGSSHAESAFYFADRKEWSEARSHARESGNPILIKLIEWQYVLDFDSGAVFSEITQFIQENPDWPEQKKLRLRAEQSLKDGSVGEGSILAWFGNDTPVSGIGKIALAKALQTARAISQERVTALVREAWKDGDFDETQERNVIAAYNNLIREEDDNARLDRLLWEAKTEPAERMLSRVSAARQHLAKARIALINDKKTSSKAVNEVPASLKNDPGLIYDRMRWRARRGDDKGVREMLIAAPETVPYPEKWWKYREQQIRETIDEGNYTLAKKLLTHHGQEDGQQLANATWLKGWLELEFLKQPKTAYETFYAMYGKVKFPVSKARAAFWSARAAEKSGDQTTADSWYNTASSFPTTFYGQLSALKRFGTAPLHMPATPDIGSDARARFESREVVRAVKLCAENNAVVIAEKLITHLIETASGAEDTALAAELGNQVGRVYLSVRGAKKALQQQNVVLLKTGYPTPQTPEIEIERPLALAITRQESEFDPYARSTSNAMGLMQLLPSTAREVARKAGIGYNRDSLYEGDYNTQLGSLYLSRMIDNYEGSYVMATAAYNAGPGNVKKWVQKFGTPGNSIDGAINWIEKIPFEETRNYVQRVMENLQIYRHMEPGADSPKLQIGDDLAR